MSLEQASPEIKLAVDLIYLLEINNVSPQIALSALEIVKQDMQYKCATQITTLPPVDAEPVVQP
ncbi:MAG: pleiotropic regulatory protein RsmS [Plesiomonas sp.]|uniref:pleiotropic regulatory protein RsmS n=1 Tax=Plesiomonas sp. TaxID=2486279 RepID=UPI003F40BEE0